MSAWTIPEAVAEFAKAGMPVDEARFRLAVTRVARIPRAGEAQSGERGGRGHALYPVGELQRLHGALAPWLVIREPPPGGG
ncbi:hypothetical protein [Arthrobacter sp.]|uniref:hypothetical protein n=1 Tax=Arthrobacter sp. TaxID=1667 RepID=UPI00258BBA33|nr:hypothetical protein [Arthrobacter sp.]